ncbi:hypothetical protein AVEN_111508-1 [Araneus ventricosus]|uniref:Uncharacterized protein n=1 Tax=Araneus ventricosus TaxID=182803 RepID=A0A4Y2LCJ5_ARAVE|nr:hypothetical protein AVEN_111508-1 [Araneus ventricosus]
MTTTTPELAPPNFCRTLAGGRLTHYVVFNAHQALPHFEYLVKSSFELGTLRPRSRDLSTRPPRLPWKTLKLCFKAPDINLFHSTDFLNECF